MPLRLLFWLLIENRKFFSKGLGNVVFAEQLELGRLQTAMADNERAIAASTGELSDLQQQRTVLEQARSDQQARIADLEAAAALIQGAAGSADRAGSEGDA